MPTLSQTYTLSQSALRQKFQLELLKAQGDFSLLKPAFSAYGISIKSRQVGDFTVYNVKYDFLCPFTEDWMYACRGATFFADGTNLVSVTYAFSKFFNMHEFPRYMGCTFKEYLAAIVAQGYKLAIVNKDDGSCIRTWKPPVPMPEGSTGPPIKGAPSGMFSTTLGTLNPENAMRKVDAPTFWGKSIELLVEQFPDILAYLVDNPDALLLSEIETKWNRIVTNYRHKGAMVPFVIVGTDGLPRWSTLREVAPELFGKNGLPKRAVTTTFETLDEDIAAFYQMIISNPDEYGDCPEGACIYAYTEGKDDLPDVAIPFAKSKRKEYSERHKLVSRNPGSDKDLMAMQKRFLDDTYDDLDEAVCKEERDLHVSEFSAGLLLMDQHLTDATEALITAQASGKCARRNYAGVVKGLPKCLEWMVPTLFKMFGAINEDIQSGKLIFDTLKAECDDGVTMLTKLQSSRGLHWWGKPKVEKVKIDVVGIKSLA